MAGAGRKTFVAGNVLTATEVNDYLMDQAVMRFASASARSTALPSPSEGMMSYLDSTNAVEVYNGASWVNVTGTEVPYAMFATRITNAIGTSIAPSEAISTAATVTFPVGRFTVAPLVYLTARSDAALAARCLYTSSSISTNSSQATVYITNANISSTSSVSTAYFDLVAVQMTSGSAAG